MPNDDRSDASNADDMGGLTPEEVAYRQFSAARRGISEGEVREFLQEVAQEMADAVGRERDLLAQVHDLEERLTHPRVPTEQELLDSLGEETTRVLRSAQEAADEIKANATTRAQAIIEQAEAEAARIRTAAESVLADKTREAELAATVVQREAEGKAQAELRQASRDAHAELETARQRGRDMVAEARAVRERILADLGKRRTAVQAELEQLRVARDELLGAGMVAKSSLSGIVDALAAFDKATAGGPDTEAVAKAEPAEADAEPEPEVEAEAEAEAAPEPGAEAEEPAPEPEAEPAPEPEPEAEPAPEPEPEAEPAPEAEPEPDAESAARPPVDELFARIRADRTEKVEAARAVLAPVSQAGPLETEAPDEDVDDDVPEDDDMAEGDAEEEAPEAQEGVATAEPEDAEPGATVGEPEAAEAEEPEGDQRLLAEREAALAPIRHDLLRACKRALQDEQNDLLDRLRRQRRVDVEQLLPPLSVQVTDWADVLEPAADEAYGAGRRSLGATGPTGAGVPRRLASELAEGLVTPLRERLLATFDAVADEAAERGSQLASRVGARYREWRSQELEIRAGDLLTTAYTRGFYDAAPEGAQLRWVPAEASRCADCDDNALEPTSRGAKFPTGQQHPPAHPGCRCLLAIVDNA